MADWLDPVRRALDQAPAPVQFFFRDDDAGWSDDLLHRLLDLFERRAVAIDLAVIPEALEPAPAHALCRRRAAFDGRLGLHQHGLAHVNHEPEGRKCEFGPSRAEARQRADLGAGRARLEQTLGAALDPMIFTPPWNRCTQATVAALTACGFRLLSRDVTAAALDLNTLAELGVCVDWCARVKPERGWDWIARSIAEHARGGQPVGIMLHHAVMGDSDREAVDQVLALLSAHARARCASMRALAGLDAG